MRYKPSTVRIVGHPLSLITFPINLAPTAQIGASVSVGSASKGYEAEKAFGWY